MIISHQYLSFLIAFYPDTISTCFCFLLYVWVARLSKNLHIYDLQTSSYKIIYSLPNIYKWIPLAYSIFKPYRGVEGKFPGGAPEAFSKESKTKIAFPRGGQDKFSRGVMTVMASRGKFSKGLRGVIHRKLFS